MARKRFDGSLTVAIDVEGWPVVLSECARVAHLPNFPANISDELYKTSAGRYIRFTVVFDSDEAMRDGSGGSYAATWLDEDLALELAEFAGEDPEAVRGLVWSHDS